MGMFDDLIPQKSAPAVSASPSQKPYRTEPPPAPVGFGTPVPAQSTNMFADLIPDGTEQTAQIADSSTGNNQSENPFIDSLIRTLTQSNPNALASTLEAAAANEQSPLFPKMRYAGDPSIPEDLRKQSDYVPTNQSINPEWSPEKGNLRKAIDQGLTNAAGGLRNLAANEENLPGLKNYKLEDVAGLYGGIIPYIKDASQAGIYAREVMGSGLGTIIPPLVGGGVGALGAMAIGHPELVPVGAVAGAVAPSYALNTGGIWDALKEENAKAAREGRETLTPAEMSDLALGFGLPTTALDMAGLGKIASSLAGTAKKEIFMSAARKVLGSGSRSEGLKEGAKILVKETGKEAGKGALTEGTTEGAQQAIQDVATTKPFGKDFATKETALDIANSAIAGGLTGGLMSGSGPVSLAPSINAASKRIGKERAEVAPEIVESVSDVETPIKAAPETANATPPAAAKYGIFSDLVPEPTAPKTPTETPIETGIKTEPDNVVKFPEKKAEPQIQKLVTPRGDQEIEAMFDVVDAKNLITSDHPDFPQVLQPRDRSRKTSDLQIQDISNKLDPERLSESRTTDTGAPIVSMDNIVESGNGRVMGIRKAYEQGNDAAKNYRKWLEDRGYDVSGMESPVLVRKRKTELSPEDRVRFTIASNERTGASLSSTERAMADAKAISDDMAAKYQGGDVTSPDNRGFINSFISQVAPADRGSMISADGELSQDGVRRVRGALLAKAYDDNDVVQSTLENNDTEIKSIGNALTSVAGQVASFKAGVEKGETPKALDITKNIIEAAKIIRDAKAGNKSVADALTQGAMFDEQKISPVTEAIIRSWYNPTMKRQISQQKIEAFLRKYYEEAAKANDDGNMLGLPDITPQDIIDIARPRNVEEAETGGLDLQKPEVISKKETTTENPVNAKNAPTEPVVSQKDPNTVHKEISVSQNDSKAENIDEKSPLSAKKAKILAEKAPHVLDIGGKQTGWKKLVGENRVTLVNPDTGETKLFINKDQKSGSEWKRTQAKAQAYAIDNPVVFAQSEPAEMVTKKIFDNPKDKPKVTTPIKQGEIGMMLSAGEKVLTVTGRETTPFPKFQGGTGKITQRHINDVDQWLMQNALDEAISRGDDFNATQFRANIKKPQMADKDSAEHYLFGDKSEQPKVLKSILKDMGKSEKSDDISQRVDDLVNGGIYRLSDKELKSFIDTTKVKKFDNYDSLPISKKREVVRRWLENRQDEVIEPAPKKRRSGARGGDANTLPEDMGSEELKTNLEERLAEEAIATGKAGRKTGREFAKLVVKSYENWLGRVGDSPVLRQLVENHLGSGLSIQGENVRAIGGIQYSQSNPVYPLATRDEWYGEGTYHEDGGKLVSMSPKEYLDVVKPLKMDDESRENIDILKEHIQSGKTLDPLLIRANGKEDGRHRAYAAMELGIKEVPVIAYGEFSKGKEDYQTPSDNTLYQNDVLKTDTPEFKKWFGNSKIVDADGKPLVVYHGTGADIEKFEKRNTGAGSRESPIGYWFTENPTAASSFADFAARGAGANVVPVYISMQNPLYVKSYDEIKDIIDDVTKFSRPNYTMAGRNIRMIQDKIDYDLAVKKLKKKGYDGIVLENTLVDSPDGKTRINQYVVFDKPQAKSINNRGTWNKNKDNILYQKDDATTPISYEKTSLGWQAVLPGAEKVSEVELDRKKLLEKMQEDKLRAKTQQQQMDFGLFDEQRTLFQRVNQSAEGLRSALLSAATNMKQAKGSGEQMLGILRNTSGVKEEEIAWTGLDDFLSDKPTVSKQEIVDYLDQNQVKIDEVTLGDKPISELEKGIDISEGKDPEGNDALVMTYEDFDGYTGYSYDDGKTWDLEGKSGESALSAPKDVAKRSLISWLQDEYPNSFKQDSQTKFSQYTLAGGENYREVLLTLPNASTKFDPSKVGIERKQQSVTQASVILSYDGNKMGTFDDKVQMKDGAWKGHPDDYWIGLASRRFNGDPSLGIAAQHDGFRSSHFDQPNILAHVRLNDRVDADGKKVLFVEEIQSDLHQQGRKKGYVDSEKVSEIQNKLDKITKQKNELSDERDPVTNRMVKEQEWHDLSREGEKLYDELVRAKGGVPNFPFKKSWHEMAFRRIAQMAAQEGYDSIAWTTGEQQNDRYDLSKQVKKINIVFDKKDQIKGAIVNAVQISDGTALNKIINNEDDLADFIGKDAAKKLLNQEYQKGTGGNKGAWVKTLEGIDLKIGGDGMKGFYDNILVKYANKFGKKFGASVGETNFRNSKDLREASIEPVHSMDITPEMREAADKGFDLFQRQDGEARGSITFMPDGKTLINMFDKANASTPFHELGHDFLELLKNISRNEEAPDNVKRDWKTTQDWLGLSDGQPITVDQHEQFARGFESYLREGRAPTAELKSLFDTFKTWLTDIYRSVLKLDVELTDEMRGVFDRMIAGEKIDDIASGNGEMSVLADRSSKIPTADISQLTKTERASLSKLIWEESGYDPNKVQRYSLDRQFEIAEKALNDKFGVKAQMGKDGNKRHAVDNMADLYVGLKTMAALNGLPEKLIGLQKVKMTKEGKESGVGLRFVFKKDKRNGTLGAYFNKTHQIHVPGRSNSVAHEWGHALDYTVLEAMGDTEDAAGRAFRGYSGKIRRVGEQNFKADSVVEAWVDLMNTIFFDDAMGATTIMALQKKIETTKSDKVKADAQEQIDRIKSGNWQGKSYRSEYFRSAKSIPTGSDKGYWTRPTEMVARAFESRMAEKFKDVNLPTDIMTFGNEMYQQGSAFEKLYPQGVDRDRIFAKIDAVMKAIQESDILDSGNLTPAELPKEVRVDPLAMVKKQDMRKYQSGVIGQIRKELGQIKSMLTDIRNPDAKELKTAELDKGKQNINKAVDGWTERFKATAQERKVLQGLTRNPEKYLKPPKMSDERFAEIKDAAIEIRKTYSRPLADRALSNLKTMIMAINSSEKAMMHAIEARNPKSKALSEIISHIAASPGKKRDSANTYTNHKRQFINKYGNRLAAIVDNFGLEKGMTSWKKNKLETQLLRDLYFDPENATIPSGITKERAAELATAAAELNRLIKDVSYEFDRAGIDVGETHDVPYLRRIYDKAKIWADKKGFLEQARKTYLVKYEKDIGKADNLDLEQFIELAKEAGFKDNTEIQLLKQQLAEEKKNQIVPAAVMTEVSPELYDMVVDSASRKDAADWLNNMYVSPEFSLGGSPSGFMKARALPAEADQLLQDYMVSDPVESTLSLIEGAADKVSWRKYVEPEDGYLLNAERQAIADGWHFEDTQLVVDMIRSEGGRSADSSGPIRKVYQATVGLLHTAATVALMGRSVFASISEPITYLHRTGHWGGSVMIWKNLVKDIVGTADAREKRRIVQAWGLIENRLTAINHAERSGGLFEDSPRTQRFMNRFFESNLLAPLTRAQRSAAMQTLPVWFNVLSHDILDTDSKPHRKRAAIREFVEAGIPENRVEEFSHYVQSLNMGLPSIDESYLPQTMPQMYMTAIGYITDHIIQNPSKMDRPLMANSPTGRFVYGLMSFQFAYYDNIIKRKLGNIKEDFQKDGFAVGAAHSAEFAAAFALQLSLASTVFLLRSALFNPDLLDKKMEDEELFDYVAAGGFSYASPLSPLASMGYNIWSSAKYQKDLSNYFVGAQASYYLQPAEAWKNYFMNNSENTDTQDRHATEASYRMFVGLPSSILSGYIPGGGVLGTSYGVANMFISSRGAETAVSNAIYGPKEKKKKTHEKRYLGKNIGKSE